MNIKEALKSIFVIPDEEETEVENENEVEEAAPAPKKTPQPEPKRETSTPRVIGGRKNVQTNVGMQVVIVKPERFDEVKSIVDHLNEKKLVLLNLQECNQELSRRIVDFLSGAAYAVHGSVRKSAVATFVVTPEGVDVMGAISLDEYNENSLYF